MHAAAPGLFTAAFIQPDVCDQLVNQVQKAAAIPF